MRYEQHSVVIVIALAFLSGCASTDEWNDNNPELSLSRLCSDWRWEQDEGAFAEIEQNAGFSDQELQAIRQANLFLGMPRAAAGCSIPAPYDPNMADEAVDFVGDVVVGVLTLGLVGPTDHQTGTTVSDTGEWGTRTVWHHYYLETWLFFENDLLVNFKTGEPDDVYPDANWDFWWGWEYDAFDFESLEPPVGDEWHVDIRAYYDD